MQESFDTADYDNDISTATAYEAQKPAARAFAPWHLPRKQFVRERQWCEQLLKMFDGDGAPEDGYLRYLGLPGSDLFDLRCFHEAVCEKHNIGLKFLGFNRSAQGMSEEQVHLNTSLDEVKKLPRVVAGHVMGDDFRALGDDQSMAWKEAQALGPYDVINLDLCDGFAKEDPGAFDQSNYAAVGRILALQQRKKQPWLLLLTTRVGASHTHDNVITKIREEYLNNLQSCEPFLKESASIFSIGDASTLEGALATAPGHLKVFLAGLSKWFLRNAGAYRPPTVTELKSVIGYRVHAGAEAEDLISLALKFKPTVHAEPDPVGLAGIVEKTIDECALSVPIIKRISKLVNADELLTGNEELNQQMLESSMKLLESARYDVSKYSAWVKETLSN